MAWEARRRRDGRGAAAVEFGLLLPVLLLVIFGAIQYGMYFWAMQGGSDIARDAARRSAVGAPAACGQLRTDVVAAVDDLTGTGGTVRLERTYWRGSDPVTAGSVEVGDTVRLEVRFESFDLQLSFLPFVDDGLVTSVARARVDYVPAQPEPC